MALAIKAENISKAYQLGEIGTGTLSRDIERWFAKARGMEDPFLKIGESNDRTVKGKSDIVWSLKDINFEINEGDAVGIIGRNGAGKSTLLKVLSRVTAPTTGGVKVKGRIASLLEVGTGFHPELTGRENIYLNGAILGMRKKEITRKFNEIVDFAGVERYIDTPVKRYSSGMYVRLAFAVAAHLESEILIVDEVLAVGDAEFQKKCLGKMGEVSKGEGRTVLFVSHNMDAIRNLCNSCLLLNKGNVAYDGSVKECLGIYLSNSQITDSKYWKRSDKPATPHFLEISAELQGKQPELKLVIEFSCLFEQKDKSAFMAVDIKSSGGLTIMQAIPQIIPFLSSNTNGSIQKLVIDLRGLVPDKYFLTFWLGPHNTDAYDFVEDILTFEVAESPTKGRTFPHTHGFIVPNSKLLCHG